MCVITHGHHLLIPQAEPPGGRRISYYCVSITDYAVNVKDLTVLVKIAPSANYLLIIPNGARLVKGL